MSISIPKVHITLDLVHPQECILQKSAVAGGGTLEELPIGKKTNSSVLTRGLCFFTLLLGCFLFFSSSLRMRRLRSSALTDTSRYTTCCSATCPTRDTRCISRNVGRLLAPSETLLGEAPGSSGEELLQFSDLFSHQLLPSLTVQPTSMLH